MKNQKSKRLMMSYILLFSLLILSGCSMAESNYRKQEINKYKIGVCEKIRKIYISGEARNFSVPLLNGSNGPEVFEYALDVNGDGEIDHLSASCGNGSDSVCDMSLLMSGGGRFDFSLPTSIRVINIDGMVIIITGLIVSGGGVVSSDGYEAHRLLPDSIKLICKKF